MGLLAKWFKRTEQPATTEEKPAGPGGEVAGLTGDPDIFQGYIAKWMSNPDPVLKNYDANGQGMKFYDSILRDAHAASVLNTRIMSVISREWGVYPASQSATDKEIADFVKKALSGANFEDFRAGLLMSRLYGYSGAEVIWSERNGSVVPVVFRVKHPRRFRFTLDRDPRLLTKKEPFNGEPVPARKFVIVTAGDSDNPYGRGIGQELWFPVWFKKQGVKWWLVHLEKFGMPTAVGYYPNGTDEDTRAKLLSTLAAIQKETAIIIPDGVRVEFMEATRAGTVDYQGLCKYMDAAISKAVLGQTLTTELSGGSLAAARVHDEVRQDILKADADLLCEALNNSLVKWLVEINYPNAEAPKIWIHTEQEADTTALSERDERLHRIGVRFKEKYFVENYGFRPDDFTVSETDQGPPANRTAGPSMGFAEYFPDQRALDAAAIAGDESKNVMLPLVAEAVRVFREASDYQEAMSNLAESYPRIGTEALVDLISRAMFVADAWGMISADGEAGDDG